MIHEIIKIMSFIKITGIDENRNIVKWLKITDDEDDIYNYKYKSEKKCETVNNEKDEEPIVESINNLIISESDSVSSISESSVSSVETNKESSNLFNKTERFINKKEGLFILNNENELDKVYKDILLKKKECEISIIINIEGNVAKYVQTLKLGICIIEEDNREVENK